MTNIPKRVLLVACCLCLLGSFTGCGSGIYPVEGIVVWPDDQPATDLAGSIIIFDWTEKQVSARGVVGADATFKLTTATRDDGAPAGDYKVLLVENRPFKAGEGSTLAPSRADVRYATPATSDLVATVKKTKNKLTVRVDRAKSER